MVDAYTTSDHGGIGNVVPFADEITRLTDTVTASERLCLLSARTIVECAMPISGRRTEASTFIPSISRSVPITADKQQHPTTSAQCVAALQQLLPVIGRFRLGNRESRGPALQPIDRDEMKAFDPKTLEPTIRGQIDCGLLGLHEPDARVANGTVDLPPIGGTRAILTSGALGYLHPMTAATILRATAPSRALYGVAWWQSLFAVLWFLNRRGSSRRGFTTIQSTNAPGTAFLTSKCVDAVRLVLDVLHRRRNQFKTMIDLMKQLREVMTVHDRIEKMAKTEPVLLDPAMFSAHCEYQERYLAPQIEWCLTVLTADSSLPKTYIAWADKLKAKKKKPAADVGQSRHDCCARMIDTFSEAMADPVVGDEHAILKAVAGHAIRDAKTMFQTVDRIHAIISHRLELPAECGPAPSPPTPFKPKTTEWEELPDWLCSDEYWEQTRTAVCEAGSVEHEHPSRSLLESLESHWRRHRDAAREALDTTRLLRIYLTRVTDSFAEAKTALTDSGAEDKKKFNSFIETFTTTTQHIGTLRDHLSKDIEIGAKWAAVLMNRHLRYAESGATTEFDPSELAHALRLIVCDSDRKADVDAIMKVLSVICAAQRPDGSWACQKPFFWTKTGFAHLTLSVQTAGAVLDVVNMVQHSPERYGATLDECSAQLQPVYRALAKSFRWLTMTLQAFTPPSSLDRSVQAEGRDKDPLQHGWCSDRVRRRRPHPFLGHRRNH